MTTARAQLDTDAEWLRLAAENIFEPQTIYRTRRFDTTWLWNLVTQPRQHFGERVCRMRSIANSDGD